MPVLALSASEGSGEGSPGIGFLIRAVATDVTDVLVPDSGHWLPRRTRVRPRPAARVPVMTVLVTGGTGTVGGHVLRLAVAEALPVRALVRDRQRAVASLPPSVDVVEGDLADASAVDAALEGVRAAFLAVGGTDAQLQLEQLFVDRAAARGVHVVKLSAHGAALESPVPFDRWHGAVEAQLTSSGTAWTLLRPTVFMQNLLGSAQTIATGQLYAPAGQAPVAFIDARDIAAVAVTALRGGHEGRTYEITGPQALTYAEVAAELSRLLGHDVEYVDLPAGAFTSALEGAGMSPCWSSRWAR
jgi:uncharacterized protein YbjT (DUF2867 family)